jgi:DNA (cytosine-5)-methyltransferase 1
MAFNKSEQIFRDKIERYNNNNSLRVLDLFSGCGGLSLGFQKAGFDLVAAIELDREAICTHAANFHKTSEKFQFHSLPRDILETQPGVIFKDLGLSGCIDKQIDIIIGGPPCQAFTRIGRAKLREIGNDASAFLNDSRSMLYKRYLDYVKALKPMAILMENVPDILNYGGINIADNVCEDLSKLGYNCSYTLLNSVYYGVPQMRERMFLIGIHQSVNKKISFPAPTHYAELPIGYHGSRNVALKTIVKGDSHKFYRPAPIPESSLKPAVTALDALSDLPSIKGHLSGTLKRGIKRTNEKIV